MERNIVLLSKITAAALVGLGACLFLSYLVYLSAPDVFAGAKLPDLGLVLYGLASAGSAFVAWGLMLMQLQPDGLNTRQILKATGIGIGLLAVMRLGVAIFPHAPFEQIRYVPIGEGVLFTVVALIFIKRA